MQNISIGDRVPIQLEEDWPDEEEEYEPEWDDEEEDEVETYTPPPVSLIRNKTPSLKRR